MISAGGLGGCTDRNLKEVALWITKGLQLSADEKDDADSDSEDDSDEE